MKFARELNCKACSALKVGQVKFGTLVALAVVVVVAGVVVAPLALLVVAVALAPAAIALIFSPVALMIVKGNAPKAHSTSSWKEPALGAERAF
jgi:hypothetical protein